MSDSRASARDLRAAVRTFLIADIRGYTAFTASRGDEAAARIAAKFAEVAGEGIEAWGGTLVETRGDEVLAAFESARSALRCAIELQAALAAETLLEPDLPLGAGIGLDAGEAVTVGEGYRGAALNLAARLSSAAAAGEVIASANLLSLVGKTPDINSTAIELKEVKGLKDPVRAFRVEAAEPEDAAIADDSALSSANDGERESLPPELDALVPLAGRSSELRWLAWHWRRAGHGRGRTLVVSGQPGIGKTRLAAELAGRVYAQGASVTYMPAARNTTEAASEPLPDGHSLVIVDDLDAAPAAVAGAVSQLAEQVAGSRTLVIINHRKEAAPAIVALAEGLASADRRRELGPLDDDAIRAIAVLYAGKAGSQLPLPEVLAQTGGVAAAVHRWTAAWAHQTAAERLGVSAGRTSQGRRSLLAVEAELMGDVAALTRARERAELFASDRTLDVCPYKGLAAFDAADADYYFGRDRLVAELVARLVGTGFLGLVGASGSGKSSAIRAGLLPALAGGVLPGSGDWPQLIVRPGEHPLAELQRALTTALPLPASREAGGPVTAEEGLEQALAARPPDGRLIIVVDQFEEVFNATRDESERAAFIDLLTTQREGLKIIVALRADHYGHCAAYPALAKLLGRSQVLVGPLTQPELAEVIEHPAQRVGLRVEPGLVDALLADLGDEPGALPLLSTALLELWQARDHGHLTLGAYRATGGVQSAVARLAEAAYAGLDPDQQQLARSIFLRLAGPGEGEGVVRRRVAIEEFDIDREPEAGSVIETLTKARLLTVGEGSVEVAHEALLREWPRVTEWLAEDASGREMRLQLTAAAQRWDGGGREPGDLYRGARLAAALDWAPGHELELNAVEREFVEESRLAAERETERQRRTNRRLRALLAGAAVFLVVALVAGGFAAYQAQVAGGAEAFARSRELAASSIATLEQDPILSKLLALEAASIAHPPVESLAALHRAWDADRVVYRYDWPADKPVGALFSEIDATGMRIVASGMVFSGPHDRLEVFDRQADTTLWSYESTDETVAVGEGHFTPDGSRVVFGGYRALAAPSAGAGTPSDEAGIHVRDAATGAELQHWPLGSCGAAVVAVSNVSALAYSSSGPNCIDFLSASTTRDLELWLIDLTTGRATMLTSHAWANDEGAISADGRTAAYTSVSGVGDVQPEVFIVDTQTGEQTSLGNSYFTEDIDPAGGRLLLNSDGRLVIWDVASAAPAEESSSTILGLDYARFSRDGSLVFTTGKDGLLRVWRPDEEEAPAHSYVAPQGGFPSATDDGLVLVPSFGTPSALLIDTGLHPEIAAVPLYDPACGSWGLDVAGANVSIDNDCGGFSQTRVVDRATLSVVSQDLPNGLGSALSPDGTRIARQAAWRTEPDDQNPDGYIEAGSIDITDLNNGSTLTLDGLCTYNADQERNLHLPDQSPGCAAFPAQPFEMGAWRVRWSPDGSMLAAVDGLEGYWAVWDAHDGSLLEGSTHIARPHAFDVRFSADSASLIVSYTGSAAELDPGTPDTLESISISTWATLQVRQLNVTGSRIELTGLSADGSTLYVVSGVQGIGEQAIYWLDPASLADLRPKQLRLHSGQLNTTTIDAGAGLLATGANDGNVRVWNLDDGTLVHELTYPGDEISALGFLTPDHLAVMLGDGTVKVVTINSDELLGITRASLTRGLTEDECTRFNFDPCPTLQEMRAAQ